MAKFLFQAEYSPAGVAGLRNEGGTGRKRIFADMGGTIEFFYMPLAERTST